MNRGAGGPAGIASDGRRPTQAGRLVPLVVAMAAVATVAGACGHGGGGVTGDAGWADNPSNAEDGADSAAADAGSIDAPGRDGGLDADPRLDTGAEAQPDAAADAPACGAAWQDTPLVRSPMNPLLTKGAPGSIDQLKIGPRAILVENGAWKMWYEAESGGNTGSAGYATSPDGLKWTKQGQVMSPSVAPEAWNASETTPTTVLHEGGVYKMWYHGFKNGVRQIGYATSADGLAWTKHPGNPVLAAGSAGAWDPSIAEPYVVHVGSTYYLFYLAEAGVGLATGTDGVAWTKYGGNPVLAPGAPGSWDDQTVYAGQVYWDGCAFHMWYRGNQFNPGSGIGYARSVDGKTWMKSGNNPLLARPTTALGLGDDYGVGGGVNVVRAGNQWWVYYSGMAYCCPENMGVNLATARVK